MCGNGMNFDVDSEEVIPAMFDPRKPPAAGVPGGDQITHWIASYSDAQFQDPVVALRILLRQQFCIKVDGQHRIADVEVRISVKE